MLRRSLVLLQSPRKTPNPWFLSYPHLMLLSVLMPLSFALGTRHFIYYSPIRPWYSLVRRFLSNPLLVLHSSSLLRSWYFQVLPTSTSGTACSWIPLSSSFDTFQFLDFSLSRFWYFQFLLFLSNPLILLPSSLILLQYAPDTLQFFELSLTRSRYSPVILLSSSLIPFWSAPSTLQYFDSSLIRFIYSPVSLFLTNLLLIRHSSFYLSNPVQIFHSSLPHTPFPASDPLPVLPISLIPLWSASDTPESYVSQIRS